MKNYSILINKIIIDNNNKIIIKSENYQIISFE